MSPAHQVFKGWGDLGLLGLTKPEAYGGMGLDCTCGMVMAEMLGESPRAIGRQPMAAASMLCAEDG